MRSASALPLALSKIRQTFLKWGVVILSTFSLTLILGTIRPSASSTATSLYTPPKTGWLLDVMSRSPTPNRSILAPCRNRSRMIRSSRELDAEIWHSVHPASSSISRARRDRYAMSPESRRMPHLLIPSGLSTSLKARIASGTPERSVSYVSTRSVALRG